MRCDSFFMRLCDLACDLQISEKLIWLGEMIKINVFFNEFILLISSLMFQCVVIQAGLIAVIWLF